MKAKVDEELCTGCELCVQECPEVFEMNDDQLATVIVATVPAAVESNCTEAAEQCPTEAIVIEA
ncbi:ferredoxin [Oligoflexia bacterium]|nr:ferredoxin [Oligoflexia bacterium]